MNQLTKVLLEDLLEAGKKKITAIYGGGFKPPTKGHFDVVVKATEQNPEIDDFLIYVGGGERNSITQGESIQIWELYKKYLPMKVQVVPVKSPIGDILRYAKEHPEEEVLWVIGARENNPEDFADIASRTRTLNKYPNIELRVIQTSGGVSGTAARKAAKDNNKEQFFKMTPDIEEKDQVWDTVTSVVTEVGEANLKPYKWQEVDREGYSIYVRFETESETTYSVDLSTDKYKDTPVFLVEFSAKTKEHQGSSSRVVVNKGEMYRVMSTLTDIIKTYLKKFKKVKGIVYYPSKKGNEEFGTQRDNLYRAFITKAIPGIKFEPVNTTLYGDGIVALMPDTVIKEIVTDTEVICDNCGWEWSIEDGGDDLYMCHKCGHDNNPDLDEASDPEAGTALPYGSGFAPIKENASYSKDIDVKEKILELTKHMLAKGMNIKPLPKVKFVNGDRDNARDFLGRTAYYNPNNSTITLYTEGRHPKDIVRSFSHEMIHHMQNLEDRLGDVSTTNTMEDDNIDKLEQEANLKGTMTFRNWTDSLNEVKEEVTDSMVVVLSRKGNQINLYNLRTNEALGNINTYGNEVTGVAAKKGYGPLMYELGMANIYPKGLQSDRHGNTEPAAEAVWKKYIAGASPNIKVEKLTPKDRDYRTTYAGDGYDSSFIPDFYNYKFYNPNTAILKQLIKRGNALSDELKKQILLDSDKLYNEMVNEANLKGTMTFRNWTDSLNENTTTNSYPFKVTDKTYDDEDDSLITVSYELTTPDNSYRVEFYSGEYSAEAKTFDLSFGVNTGRLNTIDTFQMTGEGNARKIFKTILNIVEDFINKEDVEKIVVDGTDEKRKRIYKAIFSSTPPNISDKIELKEAKNKDPFGLLENLLNEGRYDKITRELTDITINAWKDDEKSGEPIGRVEFEVGPGKDFEYGDLEFIYRGIAVFANIYQYRHNGSATPDKGMVEVDFYIPRSELPKMWEKIYFDLISVIRHEIEHLTQSGKNVKGVVIDKDNPKLNRPGKQMADDNNTRSWLRLHQSTNKGTEYYELEKEVDANLQGLYLKAKKTRTPFDKVVDDYLKYDVKFTPSQIEYVKNVWRPRLKALSLPLLETKYKLKQVMNEEETEQTYTIYCDMDGVLVDFDKGYKALTGKETTHVDVQGKNEFWGTFRNGLEGRKMSEKDYWANLQWMPDGKDLWNHIKQYKPTLLSAPSRDPQSRWGKRIWVKKNIPGTPLILAYAESKKNYANKTAILIDDRISNINDWNAAGGIGILHTSTETTLEKLSKYGI
jgi:hypothetical protein